MQCIPMRLAKESTIPSATLYPASTQDNDRNVILQIERLFISALAGEQQRPGQAFSDSVVVRLFQQADQSMCLCHHSQE